jgi:acyl-coenzyme A thioesterase PaaI-like protein
MRPGNTVHEQIMAAIRGNLGENLQDYYIPPPVFGFMEAEFISYDPQRKQLIVRFPILESYLNPYGAVQGGMLAAAVDNALGPLSVLVGPPNLTRRLELTYSKPVRLEMKYIQVEARLLEQDGRRLIFAADVRDLEGVRLARARAIHWILDEGTRVESS